MNGGFLSVALLGVLGVLLVVAAATDLRNRTIANELTGAIALLAPVHWFASGLSPWPDMAVQLGLGLLVFALFAVAFWLGQMGGGDVKLLGALALWLPLFALGRMLIVMAIAGGLLTLLLWGAHKLRKAQEQLEIPYGVAIAFAGLWALTERYFYHLA